MRLETGLQRHVTGMLFPLASGFKFGSLNPKLFFFQSSARGIFPWSVLLSWAGEREVEQGVPVSQTGKLNRKLRSELRCRPPPLGQRQDER